MDVKTRGRAGVQNGFRVGKGQRIMYEQCMDLQLFYRDTDQANQ